MSGFKRKMARATKKINLQQKKKKIRVMPQKCGAPTQIKFPPRFGFEAVPTKFNTGAVEIKGLALVDKTAPTESGLDGSNVFVADVVMTDEDPIKVASNFTNAVLDLIYKAFDDWFAQIYEQLSEEDYLKFLAFADSGSVVFEQTDILAREMRDGKNE